MSLCGEQLHTNTRKTYIIFWTLWLKGPENYWIFRVFRRNHFHRYHHHHHSRHHHLPKFSLNHQDVFLKKNIIKKSPSSPQIVLFKPPRCFALQETAKESVLYTNTQDKTFTTACFGFSNIFYSPCFRYFCQYLIIKSRYCEELHRNTR